MNDSVLEIPGYTVHRRLGKGGMADVYLATQESLQRKVAIKVLHADADESFSERFVKEAHIVASLRHPGIITIHDVDRLPDGRYYLAMEYLAGGDLAQHRGEVFEPLRALNIARQIASGLAVVHDKGLIHRDIKPANILFREDGSVVITDFGVAKALEIDSDLTHAGIAVGSPAYSSPEQARCLPLDARTDIYSLGVTLLELLTGSNPFRGASYTDSVMQHLQMDVPRLPGSLAVYQPLLDRMLAKEPQARYPDCHELLQDLIGLGASDPDATQLRSTPFAAAAVPPAALPQRRRSDRLRTPLLVVGALFGVLLAVAVAISSYFTHQRETLAEVLVQGELSLQEGRLLQPEQDNADYYFRRALALDEGNVQALDGLKRVLRARIEGYLALAEQRFAEDKLLLPEDDGAVYYYRQVLGWEPGDPRALIGLGKIAQRYADMSEGAYSRYDYTQALELIERGLEVEPENPALLVKRQEHARRVAAFEAARRRAESQPRRPASQVREVRNSVKQIWNEVFR